VAKKADLSHVCRVRRVVSKNFQYVIVLQAVTDQPSDSKFMIHSKHDEASLRG